VAWHELIAERSYAGLAAVFASERDEWARVSTTAHSAWPFDPPFEAYNPPAGAGAQGVQAEVPLVMASMNPGQVVAEVGSWFRQTYLSAIDPNSVLRHVSTSIARPAVLPMRTEELVFQPDHLGVKGNCWAIAMASNPRQNLARRVGAREHVRTTPFHFDMPGGSGNKQYCYHTMAFAAAYLQERVPALAGTLPYTLTDLRTVTQGKTKGASPMIRHRCGHSWCMNPYHYDVATKSENDLEEKCHHFLRHTDTSARYSTFRTEFCTPVHRSGEPCWTNVYNLDELEAENLAVDAVE